MTHEIEHRLLPRAVRLIAAGAVSRDPSNPRVVRVDEGRVSSAAETPADPGGVRVRRALLTVSDKRGLVDFARGLRELGVEIVSTGGTASTLADAGIETRSVEDYTGFPEILDGRVKTLNPRIYAGPARRPQQRRARRDARATGDRADRPRLREPLPVRARVRSPRRRRGRGDREHRHRRPDADPRRRQEPPLRRRRRQPRELRRGARGAPVIRRPISRPRPARRSRSRRSPTPRATTPRSRGWFAEREEDFPGQVTRSFDKVLDLSYGENPHQRAAYYADARTRTHLLSMVSKLHGKELSFNNLLDLDSGRRLVEEFELPAAVIIKHNNPCGCGGRVDGRGRLREGARHRPAERLRRRHVLQPADRARARRAAELDVRRAGLRARLRGRRARDPQAEAEHPPARGQGAPPPRGHRAGLQAGPRRHPRPGPRPQLRGPRGHDRRHRAQADRGRVGRAAVRLAGLQARPLERDRPRPRASPPPASAPAR